MIIKKTLAFIITAILLVSSIALTGCGEKDSKVIDIDKLKSTEAVAANTPIEESTESESTNETKPPYLDPTDSPSDDEIKDEVDKLLEPVDADAYFEEQGTIEEKIPMSEAKGILSEAEVYKIMKERGFIIGENCTCEVCYDLQGNYSPDREIKETSVQQPTTKVAGLQ